MATKTQSTPRLIRAPEVVRQYGIALGTLRDVVFRGELAVIRIGRAWFFERVDVDKFIEERKQKTESKTVRGGAAA
jgi:predicted DNA-binding transcriptional regulator AlpA